MQDVTEEDMGNKNLM